jgi:TonB family protein
MKRDFLLSLFFHIIFLLPLFLNRTKKAIEYPTVLTVNLLPRIETSEEKREEGIQMVKEVKEVAPKPERKIEKKEVKKEEKKFVYQGMGITTEGGRYPSYYLEAIISKIGENWFNPYAGKNIILKTTVFFLVRKDGEILQPKIEKSSGREDYDQYCLRAVLLTKRLPPIPEDMRVEELKIHLEFEHK